MAIEKSCLSKRIITQQIYEKYNIKIIKIIKLKGTSANIYELFSENEHYILKEFQKKYDINFVLREYSIFKLLEEKNFNTPEYITTKEGKVYFIFFDNVVVLQKFINGVPLKFFKANTEQLLESSAMYAKIICALSSSGGDFPIFTYKLSDKNNFKKTKEIYINLLKNCHDKEIRKELQNKLCMINDIENNANAKDLDKLTIANSHGDYNVSQFIYIDGKLNTVLDFINAKKMPIALELFRSYVYLEPKNKNGIINVENLITYLNEFLKYCSLNEYDLKLMPFLYYSEMVFSIFGYDKYISNNKNKDYLKIGRRIYKQCTYLKCNYENIGNSLVKGIKYEQK